MITFKKLNISQSQSQETTAYTADVYWDGRKIGMVRNDGNGGMSHLYPNGAEARADIEAATLHALAQPCKALPEHGKNYTYLEDYLDDLAVEASHYIYVGKWVKRTVKHRVVVITDGEVRTSIKCSQSLPLSAIHDAMKRKYPNGTIVNDLSADEAVRQLTQCRGFTFAE